MSIIGLIEVRKRESVKDLRYLKSLMLDVRLLRFGCLMMGDFRVVILVF